MCSQTGTQNWCLSFTGRMHYRLSYCPFAYLLPLFMTKYNLWHRSLGAWHFSTSNSISKRHSETGHIMLSRFHIWRHISLCEKENVQTDILSVPIEISSPYTLTTFYCDEPWNCNTVNYSNYSDTCLLNFIQVLVTKHFNSEYLQKDKYLSIIVQMLIIR